MIGFSLGRLLRLMPGIFGWDDAALLGASALGGIFGNRKKTQTTSTTLSPEAQSMNALIAPIIQQRLASSADLSGYRNQGITDINKTYGNAQTALDANLTARGLSTSPAAVGANTNLQVGRAGSIAQLVNSLPLLQRQMQGDDLSMANQFSALQPRTTTTTGNGNMLGGGFSDVGSMLGYLIGSGKLGGGGLFGSGGAMAPGSFPMNWAMGAHV